MRRVILLAVLGLVLTACGDDTGVATTASVSSSSTSSTPTTAGSTAACQAGDAGPIPAAAAGMTFLSGDFDGDGQTDTFSVFDDGSGTWYLDVGLAYGFHSRIPVDGSIHLVGAYGTGAAGMFADQVTDIDGNGIDEAWASDDSLLAHEVLTAYAFLEGSCSLVRIQVLDRPYSSVWVRGASSEGTDALCIVQGAFYSIHIDSDGGGAYSYQLMQDAVSAVLVESTTYLAMADIPRGCGIDPDLPGGSTPSAGDELCVIDHRWDDALNVRSGVGTSNSVIGTLPFYGYGVLATGVTAQDSQGRDWFEIDFGSGTGWVAGWLVAPAPCEVNVDFDIVLDLAALEIDADPGEFDPPGQSPVCGEGGYCWYNGSITDRHVFPVDPGAEVFLISPDVTTTGPFTLAQFADYLDGTWWDPATFWVEPSYASPDPFGKPASGQPYLFVIQNGKVVEIRQWYTP